LRSIPSKGESRFAKQAVKIGAVRERLGFGVTVAYASMEILWREAFGAGYGRLREFKSAEGVKISGVQFEARGDGHLGDGGGQPDKAIIAQGGDGRWNRP
jgi:hypothetical protein